MTLLPETAEVDAIWRNLIATHTLLGAHIHDAKIAAAMLAHAIPHILTLNTADFDPYPTLSALHPSAI